VPLTVYHFGAVLDLKIESPKFLNSTSVLGDFEIQNFRKSVPLAIEQKAEKPAALSFVYAHRRRPFSGLDRRR
jgi:hypothetical protein